MKPSLSRKPKIKLWTRTPTASGYVVWYRCELDGIQGFGLTFAAAYDDYRQTLYTEKEFVNFMLQTAEGNNHASY